MSAAMSDSLMVFGEVEAEDRGTHEAGFDAAGGGHDDRSLNLRRMRARKAVSIRVNSSGR